MNTAGVVPPPQLHKVSLFLFFYLLNVLLMPPSTHLMSARGHFAYRLVTNDTSDTSPTTTRHMSPNTQLPAFKRITNNMSRHVTNDDMTCVTQHPTPASNRITNN